MQATNTDKITLTQDAILDAAVCRFQHYGISKTTMSDIASDVDMSTANLYRYFKNKEDIAIACAQRCLSERSSRLLAVVDSPSMSADEKIKEFVNEILSYTYDQVSSNHRINELVNIVAIKCKDVVFNKNIVEQGLIKTILEQGIQEKRFEIDDVEQTALAVHTSLNIFQLPLAMTIYSYEDLQEMASVTTDLLINGITKK